MVNRDKTSVLIPSTIHRELKIFCAKQNITMVDFISWTLTEALTKYKESDFKSLNELSEVA